MSNPQPIRVLQLGSPTGLYGAERWILALIQHLPRAQIESIVGAIQDSPNGEPALCAYAARLGFPVKVFEGPGRLSLSGVSQLRRFIREQDVHVLHTHGYKTDILGFLATRGTSCKIVSTPHGWAKRADLKLRFYEMLDRLIFPFLDAVVPLSAELYDGLTGLPGLHRKLHMIPNGVDLREIDAIQTPSPDLQEWRAAGEVLIGYIGQLSALKSVETLILAFERLDIARKRLCIVGEGPERDRLQRLCEHLGLADTVRFFGYREDRLALLKGFDVLVLPSITEGTPRCLLEAMGAGVPVVASDIAGCRVLVQDGTTGRLFPVGDHIALAHGLSELLADRSTRERLAQAGRAFVRAAYSAETMAASYAALFAALIAGRVDRHSDPVKAPAAE